MSNREGIAQIKQRLREIGEILWSPAARDMSGPERQALKQEERELLLEYAELLEHQTVSRCPICEAPLQIAIDTGGLDGPWWWTNCPVDLPVHLACEHFQVFLGAMDLGTRNPDEVTENVMLGPARPFVVDRLLSMEDMQAVLSTLTMDNGDTLYLTAYFAPKPVPQEALHQEFRHEKYPLRDADGEIVFAGSKFDPWDFDLRPWAEQGKLQWIARGDDAHTLREGKPETYTGLAGTELMQQLADGELELSEAPQGQENAQYERP